MTNPRITPACAGISPRRQDGGADCWDHPRVRGDKECKSIARGNLPGSPPRARG